MFQKIVLIIALVSLIIALAVIGLLIKSSITSAKFPPEIGKCPDYFKASLSSDGTLVCGNPHNLGNCGAQNFTPTVGTDVTSIVSNCKKARNCGLTWDGVTNVQNNDTGSPYC